MAPRPPSAFGVPSASGQVAPSWMAIVAGVALGSGAQVIPTRVRLASPCPTLPDYPLLLVVQLYPSRQSALHLDSMPTSSTYRTVSKDELRRGLRLSLAASSAARRSPGVVLAWIEDGLPTIDFDASEVRPPPAAVVGWSRVVEADDEVVLDLWEDG